MEHIATKHQPTHFGADNRQFQGFSRTFAEVGEYFILSPSIPGMLYIGTLLLMDHEDGAYQIYDPTEQSGDDYDRVIWDGVARTAEMTYSSVSEDYGNGENYITSLKPGESIQVNMAWIVNENDLNNMYLNLSGDGAAYEFSDSMLKTGLVDIYQ